MQLSFLEKALTLKSGNVEAFVNAAGSYHYHRNPKKKINVLFAIGDLFYGVTWRLTHRKISAL